MEAREVGEAGLQDAIDSNEREGFVSKKGKTGLVD